MRLRPCLLLSFAVLFSVASCSSTIAGAPVAAAAEQTIPLPPPRPRAVPKNIILIIGDGMGASHVTLARLLRGSEFEMGRMPVTGLIMTHSASSFVTDSAAAATAMATGVKTNNRMIGIDPAGKPHPTVLEKAEEKGMATGVVTTADFFDATPAAFAAHHTSRYDKAIIIGQMLSKGIEVIAGAGIEEFGTGDLQPIDSVARAAGYALVRSIDPPEHPDAVRVLALFPGQQNDVDVPAAPLPALASWAIGRLSADPDGFFLLLEHEGTDTASHFHASEDVIRSLRSLDETVGRALEFAEGRNDTLVIVTGDHETGSLELSEGPTPTETTLKWATRGHTGEAVPLFAFGPGSLRFSGMRDNTEIAEILFELLGSRWRDAPSRDD